MPLVKNNPNHKIHNATIWLTGTLALVLLGTGILSTFMY